MSIEEDKKTVLKTKPIFPTAYPLSVEKEGLEEFKAGYTAGWEDYKTRIKDEVKAVIRYGEIIEMSNYELPYKNFTSIYKQIGYRHGWKSYRRFLKNTFFK